MLTGDGLDGVVDAVGVVDELVLEGGCQYSNTWL
jgi:hypothetical protein